MASRRRLARTVAVTTLLVLCGCASTLQTYSSPEHQTFDLDRRRLTEGGIAFLTPSTITGHEEDKQVLALVFADAMRSDRPDIRVVPLPATISAVNRAGLASAYRTTTTMNRASSMPTPCARWRTRPARATSPSSSSRP